MTDATLEEEVAGLIGQVAWGAEQRDGLSALDLQFGDPRPDDQKRGAYHLWIHLAAWQIESAGEPIAGSEDPRTRIAASLALLNGQELTAMTIERPSLSTTFEFGEVRLITFEILTDPTEDYVEQWILYRPDGLVVSAGPGKSWKVSPADQF